MSDLISRQSAIDALMPIYKSASLRNRNVFSTARKCMVAIEELPSAQPDISEYSDKLWRNAYERGKRDAKPDFDMTEKIDKAHDDRYEQGYLQGKADYERKTGKWIEVHGFCTPGGDPVWACSECGKGIHVYGIEHGSYGRDVSDGQWKACPNCGARMVKEGEEHEVD